MTCELKREVSLPLCLSLVPLISMTEKFEEEKHKPSSNLICLLNPHNIYMWPVCDHPPRQILCQSSGLVPLPAQQSFTAAESWGLYQNGNVQCY